MTFEQPSSSERRESFQRPIRRYFKTLDNLDGEVYYDLYSETQKIFQHELGLDYEGWMKHDAEAGYKLLHKLGLPNQDDYEADPDTSICRAAEITVDHLGALVEARVRSFDDLWNSYDTDKLEPSDECIDVRDLGVWYLNAARGAMMVYENHSNHSKSCVSEDGHVECDESGSCPVAKIRDRLTTRSVYDSDYGDWLELDNSIGIEIYQQKIHTAYELGLISKTELDNAERWTN